MANQQGNGRNQSSPDDRPSWRMHDETGMRGRRSPIDDDERMSRDRDDERFLERERERMGAHWDDRSSRWDDREGREGRSIESYGQGQSGYGAGRYETDPSFGSRNQRYPSGHDERMSDRGTDDRFAVGRGGESWSPSERELERGGRGMERGYGSPSYGMYGQRRAYGPRYGGEGMERGGMYERDMYERGMHERGGGMRERGGMPGYGRGMEPGSGGYLGQGGQQLGYSMQPSAIGGRGVQGQGGLYGQGGYNEGMYGEGGMQHRYGSQGYQGWGQSEHGGQQPYGIQGPAQEEWRRRGGFRGRGPVGYTRSDERIRELVCEVLTDHDEIDATSIEVAVKGGEVTLSGTVEDRRQKRLAEDVIENLSFVKDVQNQLRIAPHRTSREHESSSGTGGSDKRTKA